MQQDKKCPFSCCASPQNMSYYRGNNGEHYDLLYTYRLSCLDSLGLHMHIHRPHRIRRIKTFYFIFKILSFYFTFIVLYIIPKGEHRMFIKTKEIKTKKNGQCNSRFCTHKAISKGEAVIWTLHTYTGKTISAIWHKECHARSTAFAPRWDRLIALRSKGVNTLALPREAYCSKTGRVLKINKS